MRAFSTIKSKRQFPSFDVRSKISSSAQGTRGTYARGAFAELIDGYGQLVEDRLADGYDVYLMSFMFPHIGGSPSAVARTMEVAVEEAYSRVVNWVLRYSNSAYNRRLPFIWLACPDYPVPKLKKISLREATVNDGRHVHAIVLVPPVTRLKRPFDAFVAMEHHLFAQGPIQRVHVVAIEHTPRLAVAYAFKNLSRGRVKPEEVIVLPRPQAELPDLKHHPNNGQPGQVRRAQPI